MKKPFVQSAPYILLTGSGWGDNVSATFIGEFEHVLQTGSAQEIPTILDQIEEWNRKGYAAAGFLAYEAASAFGLPVHTGSDTVPLCWFGIFKPDSVQKVDLSDVLESAANVQVPSINFKTNRQAYEQSLQSIKNHIANGDTYQVNHTIRAGIRTNYPVHDLFSILYRNQPVPYAALIHTCGWSVLSLSPELFLRREGNTILSQPMKGTGRRGRFLEEDKRFQRELHLSEKDRAENIMIVDMARNDLGKICRFGSVETIDPYQVEAFRTVLQMTSKVKGELLPGQSLRTILQAAFPAASITGAPKKKTMEIIRAHEDGPRGVYCGSVGVIHPSGDFTFNVAIRTITYEKGEYTAGLGGGILWDSDPAQEYQEIQIKANFITSITGPFSLIETILLQESGTYLYLDEHLERLKNSAFYWQYPYNENKIKERLESYAKCLTGPCVVRLLLDSAGNVTITDRPTASLPAQVNITLSGKTIDSQNPFFYHKTTNRKLYIDERERANQNGFFEILFKNEKGNVTEGSISNLFIFINNQWITPPITDGLLAGVWRQEFMKEKNAIERSISTNQLLQADEIIVGNSVMGAVRVKS